MELTKLIEQCCEEKGLPSFMVKGLIKEVENEKGIWLNTLLEWLASRPTCGEEQRKFLDEVENFRIEDGLGIFCDNEIVYLSKNFNHLDINRVIKGE